MNRLSQSLRFLTVAPTNATKRSAKVAFSNGVTPDPADWNPFFASGNGGAANNGISLALKTPAGVATGWTITVDAFAGPAQGSGASTGNNSGIYPDVVMSGYWFNQGTVSTLTITGLVPSRLYNLTAFGSRAAAGRNTIYTVGNQSINLPCTNNTSQTANFYNCAADSTGALKITWQKEPDQTYGYINALTIAEA